MREVRWLSLIDRVIERGVIDGKHFFGSDTRLFRKEMEEQAS